MIIKWLILASIIGSIAGGIALIILTLMFSRQYLGLGLESIRLSLEGSSLPWYASIVKTVFTSIMAIELFGAPIAPYAAIACVISYFMTGHRSVYPSQIFEIRKTRFVEFETEKKRYGWVLTPNHFLWTYGGSDRHTG